MVEFAKDLPLSPGGGDGAERVLSIEELGAPLVVPDELVVEGHRLVVWSSSHGLPPYRTKKSEGSNFGCGTIWLLTWSGGLLYIIKIRISEVYIFIIDCAQ